MPAETIQLASNVRASHIWYPASSGMTGQWGNPGLFTTRPNELAAESEKTVEVQVTAITQGI